MLKETKCVLPLHNSIYRTHNHNTYEFLFELSKQLTKNETGDDIHKCDMDHHILRGNLIPKVPKLTNKHPEQYYGIIKIDPMSFHFYIFWCFNTDSVFD